MKELPKTYDHKPIEEKWYKIWEDKGYFRPEINKQRKKGPFTIVIPPPNITGILHLGHVLNNTIQDIIIRKKRMEGYEALWLPGTDHAGIATQNVVEKALAKEGLTRHDLGREKFIQRVWQWKEQYGSTIVKQLRKLGASCDWTRERFTLDEGLSKAVQEVFIKLFKKGFIYRGYYIINYCPRCRTALSNDEVEHEETQGKLYYIKYPLKDGGHITVATTRPETMLGDTAVAVHPHDKRYKDLIGKTVILPLMNREIPIIADPVVDMEFGTGAVKVTPAHDATDFEIGNKHNLERLLVIDEGGKMNKNAGPYKGLDRFECRKRVIEDLEKQGLLEKITPHTLSIGRCYRCDTVIEPYLSLQWFVKMKPLAEPAIKVVKEDRIRFFLPRWKKVYFHWMENVRDWCISRQLWWGHRIPVWYCDNCDFYDASVEPPEKCPKCGSTSLHQDEDVLDTWFSSWLWPFSTLGWPKETEDLKKFYPTDVLVTAWDIIFLWVARMIMAGLEFMGEVPFKDVYFTGMVRDEKRRKMSKSLGNSPDPIELINEFGADALRMGMMLITPEGQDVLFSVKRVDVGRTFANKVWNAARFLLMNIKDGEFTGTLPGDAIKEELCDTADKWILTRTDETIKAVTKAIDNYEISESAWTIYDFFWHELCDWYIEMIKPYLKRDDEIAHNKKACALYAFEVFLRLLHPFMPFITEELWQSIPHKGESIMLAEWPQGKGWKDKSAVEDMNFIQELVRAVRNLRAELDIPPKTKTTVIIRTHDKRIENLIASVEEVIQFLCTTEEIIAGPSPTLPKIKAGAVITSAEVYLPLEGVIDVANEIAKIEREIEELEVQLEKTKKRLQNRDFLSRAPKEVVENTKEKSLRLGKKIERLREHIKGLRGE